MLLADYPTETLVAKLCCHRTNSRLVAALRQNGYGEDVDQEAHATILEHSDRAQKSKSPVLYLCGLFQASLKKMLRQNLRAGSQWLIIQDPDDLRDWPDYRTEAENPLEDCPQWFIDWCYAQNSAKKGRVGPSRADIAKSLGVTRQAVEQRANEEIRRLRNKFRKDDLPLAT